MGLFIFYVFHSLHTVLFNKNMSNSFYISATRSFLCMICIFVHEAFFCGHYPVKICMFKFNIRRSHIRFGGKVSGSCTHDNLWSVLSVTMKINVKDRPSVDPSLQRHEEGDAQRLLHRDVTFKSCFWFLWTCSHHFLVTLCTTCRKKLSTRIFTHISLVSLYVQLLTHGKN